MAGSIENITILTQVKVVVEVEVELGNKKCFWSELTAHFLLLYWNEDQELKEGIVFLPQAIWSVVWLRLCQYMFINSFHLFHVLYWMFEG